MKDEKICFLKLLNINVDTFLGGILQTDILGIPLDFKYVEPIKPTKLQRILYGKSLEHFINFELILKTLLSQLKEKVLVFVDDPILFDFVDSEDVIFIGNFKIEVLNGTDLKDKKFVKLKDDENEYVFSLGTLAYRLKFKTKPSEELLNLIERASENFDLLEPFSRLSEALEYICQNSSK